MRNLPFLLLILIAIVTLACKSNSDAKITADVKIKIAADDQLDAADIEVDTANGVVTLNGKVLGKAEETRAIEVARSVTGVQNVVSKLEIDTVITDSDVEERVDKSEESANEQREGDTNVGEAVDDASTTARVKLALAKDDTVEAYRIDVDTDNGIVTLTGTVKSSEEAQRAVQVAESIDGVKKVTSVLTIGG